MLRGYLYTHASRIAFMQRLLDALLIAGLYTLLVAISEVDWSGVRMLPAVLAVTLFALLAEMQGVYRSWRVSPLGDEIRAVTTIWLFVVFALLVLAFATKTSAFYSRITVTTWFVAMPLALGGMRLLVRNVLRRARSRGANLRTVAVVGNNPSAHRLIAHLEAMPWAGLAVRGIYERDAEAGTVQVDGTRYPLDSEEQLLRRAHDGEVDAIYIALSLREERRIEALVNELADSTASVYVVPDMFVAGLMHSRWIDFGGMPLVSVYETPFFGVDGWVKRLEDIALSSLILLLSSPLLVAIALAVKLTSHGPVLFRQRRYGLNGALVEVWKFRTMTVCEADNEVSQAVRNDARVTPLGALLRRTSLDELPQFFNVLQGTMSVVGPRPHAIVHNEQYRKLIRGYMLRHKVKPGITGWAQVNGWRGETDTLEKMQKRIEYDLEYIRNWSLWLDLKIVLLTSWRGFFGSNAY